MTRVRDKVNHKGERTRLRQGKNGKIKGKGEGGEEGKERGEEGKE